MRRVLTSELLKFCSYPACVISALTALLLPTALTILLLRASSATAAPITTDLMTSCLRASQLSQICMIAAGAAIAGQEDRQSQMRTTLLATARRRYSFGAKAALTVAISVVGCLLSGAFALALGSALFGIPLSPRDWLDSLAKFSLAAISWTLLGLLGLGVSTIAQSMLASIAILGALVVGGSSLLLAITPFARYLPDMATMRLFTNDTSLLQPAVGVAIQLVWAAVGLAIACWLYDRRDVR